ncbi:sugar phosphate isomerase/epimerase family protein [candidate division KSB1 bacterium]
MKKLKIGIDNYSLYPLGLKPMELLHWAGENGAEGVSFSGLSLEEQKTINDQYLKDLKDYAGSEDMYIEWGGARHIPRDMTSWSKKDIFDVNRKAAEQAEVLGARLIRSCSGGMMRWHAESPMTETLLRETAEALKSQKQMLKDHNIILAIETHFEFTTFELLRIFEMCDTGPGEYLGICLDTMNLLTMLEEPLMAADRILPWIVSTHIKDGGIILKNEGIYTFTTETGRGIVDLKSIISRLKLLSREINLSIEDHGGEFYLPVFDPLFISKFPDLSVMELMKLIDHAQVTQSKIESGECSILDREKWKDVCEDRLRKDITALKDIEYTA